MAAKMPPPPGTKPLSINNKQMEKYELKTGPGRKDTLPYKMFTKEEMLDEVAKVGFYSAWNDIKADINAFEGTELLVVADHEEKYGENWYICLTDAAKEAYFYVSREGFTNSAVAPRAAPPETSQWSSLVFFVASTIVSTSSDVLTYVYLPRRIGTPARA